MDLLEINSDKSAQITAHAFDIKPFRAIWKRDRGSEGDSQGREKRMARRELAYVYHMCSIDSPYANMHENDRKAILQETIMPQGWTPDTLVEEAIATYQRITQTRMTKLLISAQLAVDKLKDYFNDVDLLQIDTKGKLVHSSKDLIRNLSDLGGVVSGIEKLKEQVEKERSTRNKNRANVETNQFSE